MPACRIQTDKFSVYLETDEQGMTIDKLSELAATRLVELQPKVAKVKTTNVLKGVPPPGAWK
jgi:hypothetical protein